MEDKQNLCLYCFEPSDTQICPHCGGDASAAVPINQLSPGTMLAGRILVGRAVGQDASGIVYAAMDTRRGVVVRVREFLPRAHRRAQSQTAPVSPAPGERGALPGRAEQKKHSAQPDENGERKYIFFMDNGTGYLIQRRRPTGRRGAGRKGRPFAHGEMDRHRRERGGDHRADRADRAHARRRQRRDRPRRAGSRPAPAPRRAPGSPA